jgi:uncharacterized protein DUF6932
MDLAVGSPSIHPGGQQVEAVLAFAKHNDIVVFMIPKFDGGVLPPGIHQASWREVEERLGWNATRQKLLLGLKALLEELARAGCSRVWLDGSFVTDKLDPGDFDLVWDPNGVDLGELDQVLQDLDPPREAQKWRYGGDVLPNVVEKGSGMPFLEFFQQDSVTGQVRGIVELRLEDLG